MNAKEKLVQLSKKKKKKTPRLGQINGSKIANQTWPMLKVDI